MTEIQIDERTVMTLALSHYNKILTSTELLLQYADSNAMSITEAIKHIMKVVKSLKAKLEAEQK